MASASSLPFILSGIASLALPLLYLLCRRHHPKSAITFPPGPKSPELPALDAWVKYQEWGREYGDLVYIREKNILITNNSRTAIDLLEKRARIYSGRETSWATILCEGERVLTLQGHSAKWRTNRKLYNQIYRQSATSRFYPAQYKKVLDLTRSLVATPEQIMQHALIFSQSVMYASLYGLDIGHDDPLSRKGKEALDIFAQIFSNGFPTLERFPWLRFMPSFFPGCGFKQTVLELRENFGAFNTIPFDRAVNNLKLGTGTSVVAELALANEGSPADIEMIKDMGSTSFIAASDTAMSSITSFLLTITLHPDVQAKGRAEIDRVIGRTRLPTFEDRKSLPYVESIYREIMRLHPPVPLGISHVSTEDDYYNGYHIPKGCVVIPNVWAMNRDPNVYSEPDKFIPNVSLTLRLDHLRALMTFMPMVLGEGLVCVGRYMGDNTVWLAIAYVLATLDLRKAKDNEGNEIDIPGDFTKTFFRHPVPYISSISFRDAQARDLISATAD
ncbi:cytochrome P450 2 Le.CYP2 [Rhodocollybia butyracea]|uniref:Cytochrome P450 2 Le.CYP2 n=1 Tax=Rhodocollybia butyracea TaxID=206335 RepID=A0A9P5QBJ3_9AGAR|nr:cytochrome P450 2 Le.CYP2 [Rhodocollybia butyracea]